MYGCQADKAWCGDLVLSLCAFICYENHSFLRFSAYQTHFMIFALSKLSQFYFFLKIVISLLMYLAALVLSCCMQTLSYGMGDLIP